MASHLTTYFAENLKALTYGLEIIAHKHLVHISYYDLLVDISEGFGVWMVILILVTSSLLTLTLIHAMTSTPISSSKVNNVNYSKLSTNKSITYKTFTKFKSFYQNKI